jgi:hypothetical protein
MSDYLNIFPANMQIDKSQTIYGKLFRKERNMPFELIGMREVWVCETAKFLTFTYQPQCITRIVSL